MDKRFIRFRRILAVILMMTMIGADAGAVYAAPADGSVSENNIPGTGDTLSEGESEDTSTAEDVTTEEESTDEGTTDTGTTEEPGMDEEGTEEELPPMATGYIDVPLDIESVHDLPEGAVDMLGVPTERSYTTPDLPELRDQNPYGSCWAHSSIALAEINLMKKGKIAAPDLSEVHLAYFSYHAVTDPLGGLSGDTNILGSDNYLHAGGNVGYAQVVMSDWKGAADESTAPYPRTTSSSYLPTAPEDSDAFNDAAHLTHYYNIRYYDNDKKPDIDVIKTLVKDTGAVSISFYAMDSLSGNNTGTYYNKTNNSYYNPTYLNTAPDSKLTNHAVTIVGWDDDFSKTKFNNTPSGNGAWLIRNSWSTSSSLKNSYYGYFWMSYYESSIGPNAVAAEWDSASNYDNNYQYDGAMNTWQGYSSSKGANVFTAHANGTNGGESLRAVAFSTNNSNVTYQIDIYTDMTNESDPESGVKECTVTGSTTYPGYYTVPLPNEVYMAAGTRFAVVVSLEKEGSTVLLNAECSAGKTGDWVKITPDADPGQSYVFKAGVWSDYGNLYNANLRIKAFTDCADAEEIIIPESIGFADGIEEKGIELGYGGEYRITPTILPSNATRKKIEWTSSNPSVASVYNGTVKGIKSGTAVITARSVYGGATASCTVTVANRVTSVTLTADSSSKDIFIGQTKTLAYKFKPANADIGSIRWSSASPEILSVDDKGKITCHDAGKVRITLTIDGKSDYLDVTCSPAAPVPTLSLDDDSVITIEWDAVTGAESYEVWRGYNDELLATIDVDGKTSFSYVDETYKGAEENTTVKYYVISVTHASGGASYRTTSAALNAYPGPGSRYTIEYELGEGTNSPSNPSSYRSGNYVKLSDPTAPVGYHFDKWYSDPGHNNPKDTIETNETGNKKFYAGYLGNSYLVEYNSNAADASGTGMRPSEFLYGTEYNLQKNYLLRPGYTFKEWNTKPDGSGTSYADGAKVKNLVSEDGGVIELYAQWKAYTYKVTFDPTGGSMESTSIEYENGKVYGELPRPVREGYQFMGWYTMAYGGDRITEDTVVDLIKNIKLFAHWEACRLVFDTKLPTTAYKGENVILKAEMNPPDEEAGSVMWKIVSGKDLAALSHYIPDTESEEESWELTCNEAGLVTVRAYMSNRTDIYAERTIDIVRPKPEEIFIYEDETDVTGRSLDRFAATTLQLHVEANPADADNSVIWTSSNDTVARVSNTGEVELLCPGDVTIIAASVAKPELSRKVDISIAGGAPQSISLSVLSGGAEADIGETIRLNASVYPVWASEDIIWASSDESKATVRCETTVDSKTGKEKEDCRIGVVTAAAEGQVTISAISEKDGSVIGSYPITIRGVTEAEAAAIEAEAAKLALGKSVTLKPADLIPGYDKARDRLIWTSDNATVAAVTSAGKVTGKSVGNAKITVTNETDGNSVTYPITVFAPVSSMTLSAASINLGTGNTTLLSVTSVKPTMASDKVIWSSSAPAVATVDPESGLVTAISAGKAVITATGIDGGGKNAKCTVKVGNPVRNITVTAAKGAESLAVGKTLKLTANVSGAADVNGKKLTPANKAVTWEVIDRSTNNTTGFGKAVIDSKGVLTAISEGTVIIRARSTTDRQPNNPARYVYGELDITITPVEIKDSTVGLALNKASATQNIKINAGTTKTLKATQAKGMVGDEGIEWRITSGSEYVSISDGYGEEIILTGKKATPKNTVAVVEAVTLGMNTKGVHYKKICKITVGEEAYAVNILSGKNDVTGTRAELANKKTLSLKAAVYGSDGVTKAGNQNVIWRSSDTSVATVTDKGKVTAVSNGEAMIYATSEDDRSVESHMYVRVFTPVSKITLDKTKASLSTGVEYEGYTSSDNRYEILTPTIDPKDVYGNMASKDEYKTVTWIVSDPGKVRVAVTDTGSVGTEKNAASKIRVLSRLGYRELTDDDKATATSTVKTGPGQSLAVMATGAGSVKLTAVAYGGRKAVCTLTIYTHASALDFTQTGGVVKSGDDYSVELSLSNKAYAKSVTLKPVLDYADAAYSADKNDPLTKLYNNVKKFAVDSAVNYISADPSVAAVNAKGVITAKGKGRTVITASTADGGHARRIYVSVDKWDYGVFLNFDGPMSALEDYDTVVIDAQNLEAADIAAFKAAGHTVYSYINVGALEEFRDYYDRYKDLSLGAYENWDDEIWIDVTDPSWQKFILGDPSAAAGSDAYKGLAGRLADKGVDGYFVDNCDVYYAHGLNGAKKLSLLGGVADIMKGLKSMGLKVIINGGDTFMDAYVGSGGSWNDVIDGINQETVFSKINWNKTDSFGKASAEDLEYFTDYVERYGALGADIYLLEYTKDKKLVATVYEYCAQHGEKYKYYASPRLDLTVVK